MGLQEIMRKLEDEIKRAAHYPKVDDVADYHYGRLNGLSFAVKLIKESMLKKNYSYLVAPVDQRSVNESMTEATHAIIIKTTKVILENGDWRRKVISIKNVKPILELPEEYLRTYPHCYWNKDRIMISVGANALYDLIVNYEYSDVEFQYRLDRIRESGERLHQISKDLRVKGDYQVGERVIVI